MSRLYKRGEIWWINFRGRRISTRCTNRKAAEAFLGKFERRVADPTGRPEDNTTIAGAFKEFIAHKKTKSRAPGTMRMYDTHIGHIAEILGKDTPIASVDASEIDRYVNTRHAEGAAETTIFKEMTTLRGALKIMRRHRKYPYALDEVMPELKGASTPGERFLTMPQVDKLLAKLADKPHRRAVCAFIFCTGADLHSVELAIRPDVRFAKNEILVRGTKNAHRRREIPIIEQFRKYVEMAHPYMPFRKWGNIRRDMAAACKAAQVPTATPRDLRRSFATALRGMGLEPHLIGKLLGHADSRMVEKVYGKLTPAALGSLVSERLDSRTPRARSKKKPGKTPQKRGES